MLLVTTDSLPDSCEIVDVYEMVQATTSLSVAQKGVVGKLLGNKEEYSQAVQSGFKMLEESAPTGANAIIGVKLTTCATGSYMYLTYTGTPITYQRKEERQPE